MAERPFLPDKHEARKFCLAIGIGVLALAVVEVVSPRTVAPTGRWSWLTAPIYENFGTYGMAIWWVVVGLVLIGASFQRDD